MNKRIAAICLMITACFTICSCTVKNSGSVPQTTHEPTESGMQTKTPEPEENTPEPTAAPFRETLGKMDAILSTVRVNTFGAIDVSSFIAPGHESEIADLHWDVMPDLSTPGTKYVTLTVRYNDGTEEMLMAETHVEERK